MLFFAIMGGESKATAQQLLARVERCEAEREQDWAEYQKRKNAEDRLIWRQYACAALAMDGIGLCLPGYDEAVSDVASKMLARERELFG
jgi:hypothetical protein